jgi:hypothetical protein
MELMFSNIAQKITLALGPCANTIEIFSLFVYLLIVQFMTYTGLMRRYLKGPSSNLGRRYIIECLAVSPAPACLLAGAGLDLFR